MQNLTPTCCTTLFICKVMLQRVSALTVDHLQGAPKFLVCAANASTYMVGILRMIKIFIMEIKYYNS
jgi:hypothetical protein